MMEILNYQKNRSRLAEALAGLPYPMEHLDHFAAQDLVMIYGNDDAAVAFMVYDFLGGDRVLYVFAGLGSSTSVREKIIPELSALAQRLGCKSVVIEGAGDWVPEPTDEGCAPFTRSVRMDVSHAIEGVV